MCDLGEVRRSPTNASTCECVAALAFQLTFPRLSPEDFANETLLVTELATAFSVEPEQVVIVNVTAGSAIIDAMVLPPAGSFMLDEAVASSILTLLSASGPGCDSAGSDDSPSDSDSNLNAEAGACALQLSFGSFAVTATAAAVYTTSPPPPTPPPPSPPAEADEYAPHPPHPHPPDATELCSC